LTSNLKMKAPQSRNQMRNKEYMVMVKEIYYKLRYDENGSASKRRRKESYKAENDTLDFLKNYTS